MTLSLDTSCGTTSSIFNFSDSDLVFTPVHTPSSYRKRASAAVFLPAHLASSLHQFLAQKQAPQLSPLDLRAIEALEDPTSGTYAKAAALGTLLEHPLYQNPTPSPLTLGEALKAPFTGYVSKEHPERGRLVAAVRSGAYSIEDLMRYFPETSTSESSTRDETPKSLSSKLKSSLSISPRFMIEKFKRHFSSPKTIHAYSEKERALIRAFTEAVLPVCAGFPELDEWSKSDVKEAVADIWSKFTARQKTLIHKALLKNPDLLDKITVGTLTQIGFARPQVSSIPGREKERK